MRVHVSMYCIFTYESYIMLLKNQLSHIFTLHAVYCRLNLCGFLSAVLMHCCLPLLINFPPPQGSFFFSILILATFISNHFYLNYMC